MKDNVNIENLSLLYEKYKLEDETSVDKQKLILMKKKSIFIRILKSMKKYSIFTGITVIIYFFTKKHSLLALILKVIAIFFISSSVIGGSTYLIYNKIRKSQTSIKEKIIEEKAPPVNSIDERPEKATLDIKSNDNAAENKEFIKQKSVKVKYNIIIKPITNSTNTISKEELNHLTKSFFNKLANNGSKNYANISASANQNNASYVVDLSIDQYKKEYVVNIKMINIETSEIEFISSKNTDSLDNLNNIWSELANEVSNIAKKYQ